MDSRRTSNREGTSPLERGRKMQDQDMFSLQKNLSSKKRTTTFVLGNSVHSVLKLTMKKISVTVITITNGFALSARESVSAQDVSVRIQ